MFALTIILNRFRLERKTKKEKQKKTTIITPLAVGRAFDSYVRI